RGIMPDNMIICISGLGPGHCMAMDLNIEHLIGYLKASLPVFKLQGSARLGIGNIFAAIVHLQRVKKKVTAALGAPYQGTGHTTPDTTHLVWRVRRKVAEEQLQALQFARSTAVPPKLTKDILALGEDLLRSSTLGTFNKKILVMIEGHLFEETEDEVPAINFGVSELPDA
ncbi:hypothetical protein B0H14DRAFT_2355556, partial [Mycena olivaceomarginata]